jgi:two-component sensor histidine kinase
VKYAKSRITVRIDALSATSHSLSVLDDGPGLPLDFDPAKSSGLGMKIILSLVKQIGGAFQILPVGNGRGARFTVTFCSA